MKKLFLLIIVFAGAFGCMQAQNSEQDNEQETPQRDYSGIIDRRVEDLTEMLSLTEDQITQVRAIYEKTLGVEASDENGVSSSDQRHNEIMELLDSDQKVIYQDYLDERENRFRGRGDQIERA